MNKIFLILTLLAVISSCGNTKSKKSEKATLSASSEQLKIMSTSEVKQLLISHNWRNYKMLVDGNVMGPEVCQHEETTYGPTNFSSVPIDPSCEANEVDDGPTDFQIYNSSDRTKYIRYYDSEEQMYVNLYIKDIINGLLSLFVYVTPVDGSQHKIELILQAVD